MMSIASFNPNPVNPEVSLKNSLFLYFFWSNPKSLMMSSLLYLASLSYLFSRNMNGWLFFLIISSWNMSSNNIFCIVNLHTIFKFIPILWIRGINHIYNCLNLIEKQLPITPMSPIPRHIIHHTLFPCLRTLYIMNFHICSREYLHPIWVG